MDKQAANKIAQQAKGNFPKMTDQQILTLATKLDRFEKSAVEAAVGKMVETETEYSLPKLLFLIRMELAERVPEPGSGTQSYLDTLRQNAMVAFPHKREKIKKMGNLEFIMRVGRSWATEGSAIGTPGRVSSVTQNITQLLCQYTPLEMEEVERHANLCFAVAAEYDPFINSIAATVGEDDAIPVFSS